MAIIERLPPAFFLSGAGQAERPEAAAGPWFLDPREILRALRPRWRLVLAPPALLTAAALAWLILVPAQYAASTQILIDPRGLQVVKDGVTPADKASDASLLLVDSQMRVLTSDDVLRRVVDAFRLDRDDDFVPPPTLLGRLRAGLTGLFGRAGGEADPGSAALRALRERTAAKRLERSFVIDLAVTTSDRDKSARLAQAIAETYLSADLEARASLTRKAGAALASRLGELRDAVRRSEDQAQQFRVAHKIVGTRAQLVSEQQLTQLSDQLGAARARSAELLGRLNQAEAAAKVAGTSNAVTEIVQSPTIAVLRGQLSQLEAARADTVTNLGPAHPAVRASELQLRAVRGQIEAEVTRIVAAARNEYKASVAKETARAATLEARKAEALKLGDSFVRLRELERQADASRVVYESFMVRARELQEQQDLDTSSSRIISPALPPERRQGPQAALVLAAALMAGLGLGVVGGLVAAAASGRVGSGRRLAQAASLPVFGTLPSLTDRSRPGARSRRAEADYALAAARVRMRLQRELREAVPLAVLVTSADDRAGKSALARALAASAALDGQRVLLVDADPQAALSQGLGTSPVQGVADLMSRRAPVLDAVARVPSGISLLPVDARAIGLGAAAVAAAILEAAAAFDIAVADIGMFGADAIAEALAQDPRFPAVVFVASAQNSTVGPLRRALDVLGRGPRLHLVMTDDGAWG